MAEEEGQEVIFTENTAPDREIWDEKGGLIKKGAAEIAERDQDHVPEVKVGAGSLKTQESDTSRGPHHTTADRFCLVFYSFWPWIVGLFS
eukprot:4300856-Amphidinium_carterae.1